MSFLVEGEGYVALKRRKGEGVEFRFVGVASRGEHYGGYGSFEESGNLRSGEEGDGFVEGVGGYDVGENYAVGVALQG